MWLRVGAEEGLVAAAVVGVGWVDRQLGQRAQVPDQRGFDWVGTAKDRGSLREFRIINTRMEKYCLALLL